VEQIPYSKGKLIALSANIKLVRKNLSRRNTLAYFAAGSVTKQKKSL